MVIRDMIVDLDNTRAIHKALQLINWNEDNLRTWLQQWLARFPETQDSDIMHFQDPVYVQYENNYLNENNGILARAHQIPDFGELHHWCLELDPNVGKKPLKCLDSDREDLTYYEKIFVEREKVLFWMENRRPNDELMADIYYNGRKPFSVEDWRRRAEETAARIREAMAKLAD